MSSPGARYVTRKQYESHTGKQMHSGGLTPEQMGYAPARRTTTKSSGLGFLGKKPAGFVSRETTGQSHRGVTLFMIGIGLVIVLTAKNSAGQTYVQAAIGWVKGKTTGPGTATGAASTPGGQTYNPGSPSQVTGAGAVKGFAWLCSHNVPGACGWLQQDIKQNPDAYGLSANPTAQQLEDAFKKLIAAGG